MIWSDEDVAWFIVQVAPPGEKVGSTEDGMCIFDDRISFDDALKYVELSEGLSDGTKEKLLFALQAM